MNKHILLVISFFLDILLLNFLNYSKITPDGIYPMLFTVCYLCYVLSAKKVDWLFYLIFIIGNTVIYNNIFISLFITFFICSFSWIINKYLMVKNILIIPILIMFVFLYHGLLAIIFELNYLNISLKDFFSVVISSLNINILYGFISYLIFSKRSSKKRRKIIRINR